MSEEYITDIPPKKAELLEIVEKEYAEFRADMLKKTKQEIFGDNLIINFYGEIRGYLNDNDLTDDDYTILIKESEKGLIDSLWGKFLSWDGMSIGSYEETGNFVSEFIEYAGENQEQM